MSVFYIAKRNRGDLLVAEAGYLIRCLTKRSVKIDGVYTQLHFQTRRIARRFLDEHTQEGDVLTITPISEKVIDLVKTGYEQERFSREHQTVSI